MESLFVVVVVAAIVVVLAEVAVVFVKILFVVVSFPFSVPKKDVICYFGKYLLRTRYNSSLYKIFIFCPISPLQATKLKIILFFNFVL